MPIGEIGRARDIPVQFLEGLFASLRRGGILTSQRGVKGGYSFARPPSEITVLEVVELLEGEVGAEAAAAGPPWTEVADAVKARPGGHHDRHGGRARGPGRRGADVLHLDRLAAAECPQQLALLVAQIVAHVLELRSPARPPAGHRRRARC